MTLKFPFNIGQALWTQTCVDGEWVEAQCEVKSYEVDECGVTVTVRYAGGRTETLDISSDGNIDVDEKQIRNQLLFTDYEDLMTYLREEKLI